MIVPPESNGRRFGREKAYGRASIVVNFLNAKLNPICNLLTLLGTHHILHVGRIRVK